MATGSTIQRIPRGYLELFGLKGPGSFPAATIPVVQPTVEMLDFYGAESWTSTAAVLPAAVVGNSVQIVVPAGEVWVMQKVTAGFTYAAATTLLQFSIRGDPISPANDTFAEGTWPSAELDAAGGGHALVFLPPRPWVWRSGGQWNVLLNELIGSANGTLVVAASFYRLLA